MSRSGATALTGAVGQPAGRCPHAPGRLDLRSGHGCHGRVARVAGRRCQAGVDRQHQHPAGRHGPARCHGRGHPDRHVLDEGHGVRRLVRVHPLHAALRQPANLPGPRTPCAAPGSHQGGSTMSDHPARQATAHVPLTADLGRPRRGGAARGAGRRQPRPVPGPGQPPVPQSAAMEDALGVRFSRVAVVGDGGLLTVSYVVLDAEKATRFQSDTTHPPVLRSEARDGVDAAGVPDEAGTQPAGGADLLPRLREHRRGPPAGRAGHDRGRGAEAAPRPGAVMPATPAGGRRPDARRRSRARRLVLLLAAVVLAVVVGPVSTAQAHAFLAGSNPADGQVLTAAPRHAAARLQRVGRARATRDRRRRRPRAGTSPRPPMTRS